MWPNRPSRSAITGTRLWPLASTLASSPKAASVPTASASVSGR